MSLPQKLRRDLLKTTRGPSFVPTSQSRDRPRGSARDDETALKPPRSTTATSAAGASTAALYETSTSAHTPTSAPSRAPTMAARRCSSRRTSRRGTNRRSTGRRGSCAADALTQEESGAVGSRLRGLMGCSSIRQRLRGGGSACSRGMRDRVTEIDEFQCMNEAGTLIHYECLLLVAHDRLLNSTRVLNSTRGPPEPAAFRRTPQAALHTTPPSSTQTLQRREPQRQPP